jgi:putative NIF3 family GTP cyclohydrolase 1 type 2
MKEYNLTPFSRRQFITTSAALLGTAAFAHPLQAKPDAPMTIADVIDLIKKAIPLDVSNGTVDTVKAGDAKQPVTGIITTMFATIDVIRAAADLKANFIIAHEPTFYGHLDEKDWLKDHEVFKRKMALLEENKIVVWRFHDYIHANKPDGVLAGVLSKLGWEKYSDPANPILINHPGIALQEVIKLSKKSLGIESIRYIGDPSSVARKIAVMPGAWGGRRHMEVIHKHTPDLLICGELQEWETSEYIRDSRSLSINRSVIVLGHSVSEEPGMEWLVPWLQPKVPGVTVTHIASGNPFKFA